MVGTAYKKRRTYVLHVETYISIIYTSRARKITQARRFIKFR